MLFHPEVAYRDCSDCQKFLYYETGDNAGQQVMRGGVPVKRHAKLPPPCRTPTGCKKGTPENLKTLSEHNAEAYLHYRECRAVGTFPDDAIVHRNAAIIRDMDDARKRKDELEFQRILLTALAGK